MSDEVLVEVKTNDRVLVRVTDIQLPDDLTIDEARRVIQEIASWAKMSFDNAMGFHEDMVKMEKKLHAHGIPLD